MPWRQEAKKDVLICEKLRQADKGRNNLRYPNGETRTAIVIYTLRYRSEPGEVKHLSTLRKRNQPRFPK